MTNSSSSTAPPAGNVVDVACDVSDFVIVPATQGPFELSHALETAESLDAAGKPYALLLLKVENNKLAGNAVNLIRERGAQRLRCLGTQEGGHAEGNRPCIPQQSQRV